MRIHHTLGQSLQKSPSFINVTDLSMYPLKILFRYLVGNSFTVTHFSDQGTQVTTTPDLGVSWLFFLFLRMVISIATFLSVDICVIKPTQQKMQTNLLLKLSLFTFNP